MPRIIEFDARQSNPADGIGVDLTDRRSLRAILRDRILSRTRKDPLKLARYVKAQTEKIQSTWTPAERRRRALWSLRPTQLQEIAGSELFAAATEMNGPAVA